MKKPTGIAPLTFTGYIFLILVVLLSGSCGTDLSDDPAGQTDVREKFLGTWNVNDQPARLNYQVTIIKSPANPSHFLLENFADLGKTATGLVVNKTVILDQQEVGGGFTAEGSGSYISGDKLEFEFFLNDGIDKELRKAIFSR